MTHDTSPRHAGSTLGAMRPIPYMGVIYVVAEAMKLGYENGHPDWCNLGQGQPEVGPLEGAPPRIDHFPCEPEDHAYGHVNGVIELREAVAAHYARLFRTGKDSQYTADNVAIAAGGRLMLSRIFAALGDGKLGYQIPDYTAYEDMIGYHEHRFTPVAIAADEADGFVLSPERLEREIVEHGLASFVVSNPCNPTGQVLAGDDLAAYVDIARRRDCTLILDEFYSHFIYDGEHPGAGPVSGAEFVVDVERDPVLLVDGLTKSFRYPGWRVGWTLGPSAMIENLAAAASAIDGGPSRPVQRAARIALEPARADQETTALRAAFSAKRNLMLARLAEMGIRVAKPSDSTFYVWACLSDLPAPLRDGHAFFRAALERGVLTVPGVFFDVNPGKHREGPSPFEQWMRFSFGPPMSVVEDGLERLATMIAETRDPAAVEATPGPR